MASGASVMILSEIRQLLVHASLHEPAEGGNSCGNKGRMMSKATTALILKAQCFKIFFVLIIVKVWLEKAYFNNGAF